MAIELISVPALLARPYFCWASWARTRTHWLRTDDVALAALCKYEAPLEKSADGLGRSPTSIAHRARDTGLTLPPEWRDAIRMRKPKIERLAPLQYPYIRHVRGEHAELLHVNSLVPRSMPDELRADVCQEIMLAIWEGRITIDELQSNPKALRSFTAQARTNNFECGGYAISLDVPMRDGRSWYDILPNNREDAVD